ncbi:MAG: hypothetical protein JXO22_02920, partial [Phycisphaerae bacterium]|nr:hypothetical protein [Phycisphaerae bacterium]
VRVSQEIQRRDRVWNCVTTGTVLSISDEKTGSWYAHAKDDKYWLRRLKLRKDDGEITTLIVDGHTDIVLLEGDGAGG